MKSADKRSAQPCNSLISQELVGLPRINFNNIYEFFKFFGYNEFEVAQTVRRMIFRLGQIDFDYNIEFEWICSISWFSWQHYYRTTNYIVNKNLKSRFENGNP